ncbi:MerR family transcriptional regulator [Austwickia sp. TVS 96-490-7B]|uniref:MerR family transcriptional regulator n=1 Tax=Austwickia sp. TVS 96-490-7B TaxID=2830843 RepID=UPI00210836C8|nr:MerR family transcriptional regulator [Austwickia sp. TVS 96-490-7B]
MAERDLDSALMELDHAHAQLLADRHVIDAFVVRIFEAPQDDSQAFHELFTPIELARRVGVTTTTLRAWEDAGILHPQREPGSGRRQYRDADVRNAELAHLLRRAGHGLREIAETINAVHTQEVAKLELSLSR